MLVSLEVAVERAARHILHYQDYIFLRVNHLVQLNDVEVVHFFKQFDFPFD